MVVIHKVGQCHKSFNNFDERYFLEHDVQYLEKLPELHNVLPFLPEKVKN